MYWDNLKKHLWRNVQRKMGIFFIRFVTFTSTLVVVVVVSWNPECLSLLHCEVVGLQTLGDVIGYIPCPDQIAVIFSLWSGGDTNFLIGPIYPLPWPEPGSYFNTPIILVCVCAQSIRMTHINHSCSPQFGCIPIFN